MLPSEKDVPRSKIRNVLHYQQRSHWDCGVSCILMAMDKDSRDEIVKNLPRILNEEGFGSSTWTIDLCYMMLRARPEIPFRYTTITLGVDPSYANQAFYNNIIKKDSQRVNERFQKSASRGFTVEKKSVDMADIIEHIARKGVAIVLTDANLLNCITCNYYSMTCIRGISIERNCLKICGSKPSYQGHFVVAVGYDLADQRIIYRNPSLTDRECQMTFKDFEEARTAFGTDEDIIFVDNDLQQRF